MNPKICLIPAGYTMAGRSNLSCGSEPLAHLLLSLPAAAESRDENIFHLLGGDRARAAEYTIADAAKAGEGNRKPFSWYPMSRRSVSYPATVPTNILRQALERLPRRWRSSRCSSFKQQTVEQTLFIDSASPSRATVVQLRQKDVKTLTQ